MLDNDIRDLLRKYDQQDMLASILRTALAVAVPFGGVLNEFVTHFIPAQRVSRLVEFAEKLYERLAGLEEEFREYVKSSPGFAVLTEEAILAAVRTGSSERRRDLAELLKSGLKRPDAELLEHEKLLRLLEQLNDAQVLILMYYGNFKGYMGEPARAEFVKQHAAIFDSRPPDSGASDDDRRRWTLYRLFEDELVNLGLLRDTEGTVKASQRRKVVLTDLGRLLLDTIGRGNAPTGQEGHK